jgi:membrane-associated phospholipid phosphatase
MMLTAAGFCLAAFLALAVPAAEPRYFTIDHVVRGVVESLHHHTLETPMAAASLLGYDTGLVPLIALASAVLWRAHRRWALALPLVMAGTGVLQWAAKWAVDRARPNEAPWGFPSGHVLSVVVFFGLVAFLVCGSARRAAWRRVGATLCALTVFVVAFSRLYLGVHWFSDVIGGLLIGLAYLLTAISVLGRAGSAGTPAAPGRAGEARREPAGEARARHTVVPTPR